MRRAGKKAASVWRGKPTPWCQNNCGNNLVKVPEGREEMKGGGEGEGAMWPGGWEDALEWGCPDPPGDAGKVLTHGG